MMGWDKDEGSAGSWPYPLKVPWFYGLAPFLLPSSFPSSSISFIPSHSSSSSHPSIDSSSTFFHKKRDESLHNFCNWQGRTNNKCTGKKEERGWRRKKRDDEEEWNPKRGWVVYVGGTGRGISSHSSQHFPNYSRHLLCVGSEMFLDSDLIILFSLYLKSTNTSAKWLNFVKKW